VFFIGCALWFFFHALPFEGYYYKTIWSKWWFPFLLAVPIVLKIGGISWLIDSAVYGIMLGNDQEYQSRRSQGWHPFWDEIPRPINPDTEATRQTGDPNGFVPPANWQFCCPVCGARVEKQIDVCWRCHYGAP
jgi:hypothetical protein